MKGSQPRQSPAVFVLRTEMLMMLVINSAAQHPLNAAVTCGFSPQRPALFFLLFPSNFCTEKPGSVWLRRNVQVNCGGHAEPTNQHENLSENGAVQRTPNPLLLKMQLKAQMRHMWQSGAAKCNVKKGAVASSCSLPLYLKHFLAVQ